MPQAAIHKTTPTTVVELNLTNMFICHQRRIQM